jgi:hypothetical protein
MVLEFIFIKMVKNMRGILKKERNQVLEYITIVRIKKMKKKN